MYACVLPVCSVHKGQKWLSPRTDITVGYELPCRWWELSLGLLEEQPVFLTDDLALDGSSQSLQKVGKWIGSGEERGEKPFPNPFLPARPGRIFV